MTKFLIFSISSLTYYKTDWCYAIHTKYACTLKIKNSYMWINNR